MASEETKIYIFYNEYHKINDLMGYCCFSCLILMCFFVTVGPKLFKEPSEVQQAYNPQCHLSLLLSGKSK